jgi:hypothetical protein
MENKFIFIALVLFLSGCSSVQHIRKSDYYSYDYGVSGMVVGQSNEAFRHHPIFADIKELSLEGPANKEQNLNYFLFGTFPLRPEVKLSEVCGKDSFRQAYVSNNLWQGLVSILTIGIYTPRTLQVWCGDAKKSI